MKVLTNDERWLIEDATDASGYAARSGVIRFVPGAARVAASPQRWRSRGAGQ